MLRPIAVRRAEPAAVEEHHLGERLTAFLDGELGHDARERVQAHLATCDQCLAEADEARSIKRLLTGAAAPGPSALLMSRLMAVAALPDDEPGGPADPGGSTLSAGTIGGSRLTGGSFGRGAGASFGAGAFGVGAALPVADPSTWGDDQQGGRGVDVRLWSGRRAARTVLGPGRPAAVAPVSRPPAPRGRRLVFAAAGAFSVAAVTLGGFGSLGLTAVAGDSPQQEDQHRTAVTPQLPAGAPAVPLNAPLTVDFPLHGSGRSYQALTPSPSPSAPLVGPVSHGRPSQP
ncbi:anti-sigma factor family protein [Kitasatospora sp. NPDC052896]|uniref:anti-sigma factor family protein n=1 Tax=Kitasatospora sp. NPDC052896 TaxID=3364061 RepID=UPI0037C5141C